MKVIVTAGENRIALTAVQALGRRGIHVAVVASRQNALSFSSRYCRERIISPSPVERFQWVSFLLQRVKKVKYDAILFCSHEAADAVSEFREEFCQYVKFALPGLESYSIAENKNKTLKFAEELGIPVPWTTYPLDINEVERVSHYLDYPVVIKGLRCGDSTHIRFVSSSSDLIREFREISDMERSSVDSPPMIQKYIQGVGYNFLALFQHGTPRATFMVKKIREYPVTGGSCVHGESVFIPELQDIALQMLTKLAWDGFAEVEFILDSRDQNFKLIEVNRDFGWTQDLAIACGVDFPFLYCEMLRGSSPAPISAYDTGVGYIWLFPHGLLHILVKPFSLFIFLWSLVNRRAKFDVFSYDIRVAITIVRLTVWYLKNALKTRSVRYPQGNPRIASRSR